MEKKTKIVSVRLSEEDFANVEELGSMAGWSVSKTCSNLIHIGFILADGFRDEKEKVNASVDEVLKNVKL